MADYTYNKYCDPGRLYQEIKLSVVSKAVDYINTTPTSTTIFFKEALSDQNESDLDAVVEAHVATPLPEVAAAPVIIEALPAYGARKIKLVDGSERVLYGRNKGIRPSLVIGSNVVNFVVPHPWCKLRAIEAIGGEVGDYTNFEVYDSPLGTYSGVPNALLNVFATGLNIAKDYYNRDAKFDSDIYQGMILRFTITSVSNKTIGINIIMDEVKTQ